MKYTFFDFVRAQWTTIPPVQKQDLSGKTVIVTGGNTGIGLEVVRNFARMNPAKLILTSRSQKRGEEVAAQIRGETGCASVEAWALELAEFASVRAFCDKFERECDRLDILVENAGIATVNPDFTKDGWELSTQVNDMSTTLLSLLLLPRMLETAQKYHTYPRIVVASSETHHEIPSLDKSSLNSPNFFRAFAHKDHLGSTMPPGRYQTTKLLNILLVRALSERLHRKPLITNSANPGFCKTGLRRNLPARARFVMWVMDGLFGRTADDGARVFVWAALGGEEEGRRDELRGAYVDLCSVKEPSDYVVSKEGREAGDKIWDDLIEELVKVEPKVQSIVKEYLTEPVRN
ncbi:Short-chain dehydrogenase/reductase phmF [Psilocybe cubensis]|uniref:Short-chain dehydrogenase/reductase phmF n=2 Tax=Psilocybe cubensis TaxID=181762 RepID=A0ACB8GVH9_PSICU|nr:Short-chain dehydrogenase/reductase phmF [Psilocybe cubensis]KAH9479740.1 Short-chain dehydrogenase/reductase phmF [Psilocybe cubensis]